MTRKRCFIIITAVLITTGNCASDKESMCPTLTHDKDVNINTIMGIWYAIRGIEHTDLISSNRPGTTNDCRALTLSQNDESQVIFQWNEGNNVIKFKPDSNTPNLWRSISQSSGHGLTIKVLQVTEIDKTHIVITVCSSNKKMSSAVLSREPKFSEQQILTATNKLSEQGLRTIEVFDRCQNKRYIFKRVRLKCT
ncbi:uncharacterized protein LOC142322082 [Lycorma delicatula]|uniref:uncharacterized protein LOC142322082 n=1 Tax=Lycorma delicatula TaxID=130591 RepID=UPI003F5118BA